MLDDIVYEVIKHTSNLLTTSYGMIKVKYLLKTSYLIYYL